MTFLENISNTAVVNDSGKGEADPSISKDSPTVDVSVPKKQDEIFSPKRTTKKGEDKSQSPTEAADPASTSKNDIPEKEADEKDVPEKEVTKEATAPEGSDAAKENVADKEEASSETSGKDKESDVHGKDDVVASKQGADAKVKQTDGDSGLKPSGTDTDKPEDSKMAEPDAGAPSIANTDEAANGTPANTDKTEPVAGSPASSEKTVPAAATPSNSESNKKRESPSGEHGGQPDQKKMKSPEKSVETQKDPVLEQ